MLGRVFITIEGPEGAGKSTVAQALGAQLEQAGKEVLLTREPGSGTIGQKIRSLLLDGGDMKQRCELFLFLADRSQHVETLVRPALEAGKIVLCDRFADSTVVYQGHARGLDLETLRRLNDFATGGLLPDLTLLLDIDPVIGTGRLLHKDRLDSEPLEFHQRVRNGFLAEATRDPARWIIIDASNEPETVFEHCWSAVSSRL